MKNKKTTRGIRSVCRETKEKFEVLIGRTMSPFYREEIKKKAGKEKKRENAVFRFISILRSVHHSVMVSLHIISFSLPQQPDIQLTTSVGQLEIFPCGLEPSFHHLPGCIDSDQ